MSKSLSRAERAVIKAAMEWYMAHLAEMRLVGSRPFSWKLWAQTNMHSESLIAELSKVCARLAKAKEG